MPSASAPASRVVSGRRFVGILLTVLVLLLAVSFAGWFWSKANKPTLQQFGAPKEAGGGSR